MRSVLGWASSGPGSSVRSMSKRCDGSAQRWWDWSIEPGGGAAQG